MPVVSIDSNRITDWPSFHAVFAEKMGFPDFYGRNMSAWIDCMTSLDSPADGMTKIHCVPPDVVVLDLGHVADFNKRCPEQYNAIVECAAAVNHRRIRQGEPAVLALSFQATSP